MNEQELELEQLDEAYKEQWMTRYGFVIPRDFPDLLERFWQQEAELLQRQSARAWRRAQLATAAREAASTDTDHPQEDQRNSLPS